ncbi:LEAF RUST 10 DISEASE-RESISTANCE LOCUS RECEPTOR-LIKE PROTEIN KINASE-like 2.1 isoform X3 [Sesamum indicum]|uniref:non-specific serine/threonine protein kinase n=1 Tax=Sesamum indicum TaxID=4182 RepID=A0A8M8UL78_SESIN|nr:LEAF RUST 10 DISEASE-RESISTANCE LOCUS RECEPTOR-LIKE PROTEIN KINASE-like 2.1 isoform X3 [Sesamum indicum]
MKESNLQTSLICLDLCIFLVIFLSRTTSAAYYPYEACVPRNCGLGPNINFPFYIPGLRESFCGYPGFALNCSQQGFPVLQLSGDEYVVQEIFYETRSLRVYNAAVLSSNGTGCLPRTIRNTTLPTSTFGFSGNVTRLRLFSNCTNSSPENLWRHRVGCDGNGRDRWDLAIYDKDENFTNIALKNCERNVVAPVEDDGNSGPGNVDEVLRRGFVLNWTANDCSPCELSGGRCGFNETIYHFRCFCPDRPHSRSCRLGFAAALIVVTTFLLVLVILIKRKRMKNAFNYKKVEVFLKNHGSLAPRRYKYSELKKMTKSFSDHLGRGGYGNVYKGKSQDGRLLAIKILNESRDDGEEFVNEVASISATSHVNIVTLVGFCFEGSKRALVYEFMPNGSLDRFICGTSLSDADRLEWGKLFEIAVGIARGLEYLHRGCNTRILHLDIKPHNILLDKDFNPKISDFGLAKLCPDRASIISMSGTRGTIGYIAPEVFCRNFGDVSHKSDVYSYGMMVLDIVGERRNNNPKIDHDHSSQTYFPHWIYKHLELNDEDGIVGGEECHLIKRKLAIVGLWCIQTNPKDRPSMSRVVEMLDGRVESLQVPPKPYLSSPPRPAAAHDASVSDSSM